MVHEKTAAATALAAFAAVAMTATAGMSADVTCMADWGVAGDIVRREKLTTVEELAENAGRKGDGQIVKATLCLEFGGYVYRLVVRDGSGQLRSLKVDAKSPAKAATPR